MSWQALILGQVVLVAVATIIMRLLARDKKTAKAGLAITASWIVVLYAVGLVAAPFLSHISLMSFHDYWLRFILGGASFALSNIFTYQMLIYLDAAEGTIFGTLSVLFTVLGASMVLHEGLSTPQIIGASFLLVGIAYTTLATRTKPTKAAHRNLIKGFLWAIATAVFYAIASVNEKSLLGFVSVGDYVLFGWLWQMIAALALALLIQPSGFKVIKRRNVFSWVLVLGV